jgi:hypothetical protein
MAAINVQLSGAESANRDASIQLKNQATGQVILRQPFLDGSLVLRDIDPGLWEMKVTHPNLTMPIDQRVIRVFPQIPPTFVPVAVPPALFRDSPIRDLPDADLTPVQQAATSVRDRLKPVGGKSAGEAIRSDDWNALVTAVSDLAGATLQLTKLVSPTGHDHPEIAENIAQVQDNLRRFNEAFGRSLVELRREIEIEVLRQRVKEVLDVGQASSDVRARIGGRLTVLESALQSDTTVFTQNLATTGNLILKEVNDMAVKQGAAGDAFLGNPTVAKLQYAARQYVDTGTQIAPEAELQTYRRTAAGTGGVQLGTIVRG